MQIQRDQYLNRLLEDRGNRRIKIVTGVRRCGKSYLLFKLFKDRLIREGVAEDHIIEIAFDDRKFKDLRDPDECYRYVTERIDENDPNPTYVLLDEVQLMKEFEDVLNGFLHLNNADVFVTGSNSKFLSTDILTQFRGRGDEIRMYPLTFSEFSSACSGSWDEVWEQYYTFGGLPYILTLSSVAKKAEYLQSLFEEVYLRDILDRNQIRGDSEFRILIDVISSAIGSLTNPQKLSAAFKSAGKTDISPSTVAHYLHYLEEAFLIKSAARYDVKGKKYISTPKKIYFEDVGLRNARLNFRQNEENHIMENIIFNELRYRGFSVDVGVVEVSEKSESGGYRRKQTEIDFVANRGNQRYYLQSAFTLRTEEKKNQEKRPLLNVRDSFRKILIVRDPILLRRDENGLVTMGIKEFLSDEGSLDR